MIIKFRKTRRESEQNLDNLVESIGVIAKERQRLARRAETQYAIEVNDIIEAGGRSPRRIEQWLDSMLDFCFDDRVLALYKKLCRYYFTIDPMATASYVSLYREMWEEEISKKD